LLSYKDYVRHISYGLIRATCHSFIQKVPRTHPSANTFCITFGCKFTGEPFFIPTKELLKIRAEELQPFFSSHEMPVLVLSYKLEPYLSVFQTPKGVLKLQLEKQGLKKVLDEHSLSHGKQRKLVLNHKQWTNNRSEGLSRLKYFLKADDIYSRIRTKRGKKRTVIPI